MPLLNLPPEHWPLQSRRMELLGILPVDDEDSTPENQKFFEGPLVCGRLMSHIPSSIFSI